MSAVYPMTADDVRELAVAIFDIYQHSNWQPSNQHKRVLMLLDMFSKLEQPDDGPYPTLPLNISALANRAGVRYHFACDFVAWLEQVGYVVQVAPYVAAFAWHVNEAERRQNGGEHADA